MQPRVFLVALVLGLAGLAGCGDDDASGPDLTTSVAGSPTTSTALSTITTTTAADPLADATTEAQQGDPEGDAVALLVDARTGAHDGFDRLVFEFEGDDVPGYRVGYVEPPITQDGSGEEVAVEGSAFLEVRMEPASGVDLSGPEFVETYTGPDRLPNPPGGAVDVVKTGDFEAVLTWVVGVDREQPFSVSTLADPVRLVVDINA